MSIGLICLSKIAFQRQSDSFLTQMLENSVANVETTFEKLGPTIEQYILVYH